MSLKCDLNTFTLKETCKSYKSRSIRPDTPNATTIEVLKHYLQVTEEHFSAAAGEMQNPMPRSDVSGRTELQKEKIETVNPDGHTA